MTKKYILAKSIYYTVAATAIYLVSIILVDTIKFYVY